MEFVNQKLRYLQNKSNSYIWAYWKRRVLWALWELMTFFLIFKKVHLLKRRKRF